VKQQGCWMLAGFFASKGGWLHAAHRFDLFQLLDRMGAMGWVLIHSP